MRRTLMIGTLSLLLLGAAPASRPAEITKEQGDAAKARLQAAQPERVRAAQAAATQPTAVRSTQPSSPGLRDAANPDPKSEVTLTAAYLVDVQIVRKNTLTDPELRRWAGKLPATGLFVRDVISGGPADNAGLKAGDIVVSIAGVPTPTSAGLERLAKMSFKAGQKYQIAYRRFDYGKMIWLPVARVTGTAALKSDFAAFDAAGAAPNQAGQKAQQEAERLANQIGLGQPDPIKAAPDPTTREATPLDPAPEKRVTVSGAAYVVRRGGQSDILRGFHVTLIQSTVPAQALRKALTIVVQNYRSEAAERRKKAAGEEYKPLQKAYHEEASEFERKAEVYSLLLARVSGPVDCATALKLLATTTYVNMYPALLEGIKIAATTTDVQGAYKFTNAPTNACIFAMFDTEAGFMLWAIPVKGEGSKGTSEH